MNDKNQLVIPRKIEFDDTIVINPLRTNENNNTNDDVSGLCPFDNGKLEDSLVYCILFNRVPDDEMNHYLDLIIAFMKQKNDSVLDEEIHHIEHLKSKSDSKSRMLKRSVFFASGVNERGIRQLMCMPNHQLRPWYRGSLPQNRIRTFFHILKEATDAYLYHNSATPEQYLSKLWIGLIFNTTINLPLFFGQNTHMKQLQI
jgi:hypothetical protein